MALTLSWVSVGSGLPATSLRAWKILLFCSRKNLEFRRKGEVCLHFMKIYTVPVSFPHNSDVFVEEFMQLSISTLLS